MSKKTNKTTGLSRRAVLKGAAGLAGAAAGSGAITGFPAVWSQEEKVLRYLGTAVNQSDEMTKKVKARDRDHHPEHRRHDRRRDEARYHPAELVRHSGHRVLQPEEARALRQYPADGRQKDQGIRQHHAGLHQGPIAERQGDRRSGHRAQEGHVRRRAAFDQILENADGVGDADSDRLQCRHARHPARSHQAADRTLVGVAQPRVQGEGGDPQHPLDRHHGRRDGGRVFSASTNIPTRAT